MINYNVMQLNCGKRTASTSDVYNWKKCDIALIQEPNRGCINDLRKHGKVYIHSKLARSLIFIPANIDVTILSKYTNEDCATIQLEKQDLVICSAYLDINKPVWPVILHELIQFCSANRKRLIIGADTNAHSVMWGCTKGNSRGDNLERVIIQNNLFIHNTGDKYTFAGGVGNSIIDITMSNDPNLISSWQVDDAVTFSDHKRLSFKIQNVLPIEERLTRNIKKVNWNQVASEIHDNLPDTPAAWNIKIIDQVNNQLTEVMKAALDKQAPLKPPAKRQSYWWDDECTKSKAELRRAERNARTHATPAMKMRLKLRRRAHVTCIKKAKQNSWRKFISEVKNTQEAARVNKIMRNNKGPTPELGLVENGQDLTTSKQETLQCMLAEHFPGSTPWQPTNNNEKQLMIHLEPREWLSRSKFRAAVDSFKKGKSPGPDEIRAECLQKLGDSAVDLIIDIFNASITLGYVPQQWREVKCIFIPKPGKPDYTKKRAFRPISLMSVLFKTLERLVLWHIEQENLKDRPIHRLQFGFRKGRSCEMALSKIVNTIEKGMNQGQWVLGVFCDIAGAFDNVKPESITRMMSERGIDPIITDWYSHFLYNRRVESSLGTATAAIQPGQGTPQGGVLSAIISWNLVFDDLLKRFDDNETYAFAFADDGTLIIIGPDPVTCHLRMREALKRAEAWALEHGLRFCASKTNAVLFTKKQEKTIPPLPTLYLHGQEIPHVKSTKVLGVTLDSKLLWTKHIEQKIKQCKIALMQLLPVMRKTWSPQPRYNRWLYKDVVLPMILYGCHLWAEKLEQKGILDKLHQLQRLGLLSVTAIRRSTPTAALELIYDIPPIHLAIKERAKNTASRLHSILPEGEWVATTSKRIGHLKYLRRQLPSELDVSDFAEPEPNMDRPYRVCIDDTFSEEEGIKVYTDGSLIKGKSGSGVVIYHGQIPWITISEKLPKGSTVFQAELRAIRSACQWMSSNGYNNQNINIYVDSQAALKALCAAYIHQREVLDTVCAIETLAKDKECKVKLQWIKAHVGWEGNEAADVAAKRGALSTRPPIPDVWPKEIQPLKLNKEFTKKQWKASWEAKTDCRQSKLFLKEPNQKIWKDIKKFSIDRTRRTVRFLTGHTFMARHNTLIELGREALDDDIALCSLCMEENETPEHLVTECPCLNNERQSLLLSWQLDTPPPWSTGLADFIALPAIKELEDDESTAAID